MRLAALLLFLETEQIIDQRILQKIIFNNQYKKTYKILNEVAFDDYETGKAIKLDKFGKWYIDKEGKTIRHAKVIFKTHSLQRSICKQYINHDPSKTQDKCIEVLLCKPSGLNKWIAISTLRKLDSKCIKAHPLTYAVVPPSVFRKAVILTKAIPETEKIKLIKYYEDVRSKMINKPEFIKRLEKLQNEKPIIISSEKDIIKLLLK